MTNPLSEEEKDILHYRRAYSIKGGSWKFLHRIAGSQKGECVLEIDELMSCDGKETMELEEFNEKNKFVEINKRLTHGW